MAKTGSASLCLVLILTAFVQIGWGSRSLASDRVGTLNIHNTSKYYNMTMITIERFDDGRVQQSDSQPLPVDTIITTVIVDATICIETAFRMQLPDGMHGQNIYTWCRDTVGDCLPNCWWYTDLTGFSAARGEYARLKYVAGWNGPWAAQDKSIAGSVGEAI